MKTIKVNEKSLIKTIEDAIMDCARKGDAWSGWGVDVLIGDNGKVYSSAQNSGNQVYSISLKFCRIEQEDRKKPSEKEKKEEALEIYNASRQYFNETVAYMKMKDINIIIEL